jgi:hypothetical protein
MNAFVQALKLQPANVVLAVTIAGGMSALMANKQVREKVQIDEALKDSARDALKAAIAAHPDDEALQVWHAC